MILRILCLSLLAAGAMRAEPALNALHDGTYRGTGTIESQVTQNVPVRTRVALEVSHGERHGRAHFTFRAISDNGHHPHLDLVWDRQSEPNPEDEGNRHAVQLSTHLPIEVYGPVGVSRFDVFWHGWLTAERFQDDQGNPAVRLLFRNLREGAPAPGLSTKNDFSRSLALTVKGNKVILSGFLTPAAGTNRQIIRAELHRD
jgi:hypothetical protein